MFKQHSVRWAVLALVSIFGTAGCQSTVTESLAQEEKPATAPERVAVEPEPQAKVVELEAIYFDLDRWELSQQAQQALKSNAKQIQARPEWGVLTIEGHCDERGSDEYNIALGERRAAAVKRYLVDLGVPSSRFDTVTYGESRPAVRGGGEKAWRLNRRSEIRLGLRQASR